MGDISKNIAAEISSRIQAAIGHFGGLMPERSALAWRGYLAAMLEWNLLSVVEYDELLARLPAVNDDPAVAILRGRD
jgi:hypothetical protein